MMKPASCSAVVRPASPMTKALAPGAWLCRKSAVASAEVQIAPSGTTSPDERRRAERSLGVKIELFVSTKNGVPWSRHCCSSAAAPGTGVFSWTSTPSISVNQHSMSARVRMGSAYPPGQTRRPRPTANSSRLLSAAPKVVLKRLRVEDVARKQAWDPERLPDLSGRTYLVTGSNAGLGFFSSEQLVGAGARVYMTGRSPNRLMAA